MKIRISGIIEESIVDGPGLRFVIFTQGCPHRCVGCHNPSTHSFSGGRFMDTENIVSSILSNPTISGITLSGGEPFMQPVECLEIVKKVKEVGKNVIVYSGFTFEKLLEMESNVSELLKACDYLVDGKFKIEERTLSLQFRGSKNQRIIDVQKSLEIGKAIEKIF